MFSCFSLYGLFFECAGTFMESPPLEVLIVEQASRESTPGNNALHLALYLNLTPFYTYCIGGKSQTGLP